MNITLVLKNSICDCKLQITDTQGSRYYLIPAAQEETTDVYFSMEVFGETFDLNVIPLVADLQPTLNEWEENTWKEKLAKGLFTTMTALLDKTVLRVGCRYHITNVQDGDRLEIEMQGYRFGTTAMWDLLGLLPMMYVFFEISCFNQRFEPLDAYETNRKDVVKSAKMLAASEVLGNGFFATLITYPIQVGRIKRLSGHRKIFKTVHRFYGMSEEKREALMKKQES